MENVGMPRKRTAKKNASRAKTRASGIRSTPSTSKPSQRPDGKKDLTCPIVGIGGSAGGYEAASELLKHLPSRSGMAFVIVQHLDPHHASNLPKLLGKVTQLPVMEISGQMKPEPDLVYVLPPNRDLVYKNGTL